MYTGNKKEKDITFEDLFLVAKFFYFKCNS